MGLGHRSVGACRGHACGSLRLHVLVLRKNAFSARGNGIVFLHSNVGLVVRLSVCKNLYHLNLSTPVFDPALFSPSLPRPGTAPGTPGSKPYRRRCPTVDHHVQGVPRVPPGDSVLGARRALRHRLLHVRRRPQRVHHPRRARGGRSQGAPPHPSGQPDGQECDEGPPDGSHTDGRRLSISFTGTPFESGPHNRLSLSLSLSNFVCPSRTHKKTIYFVSTVPCISRIRRQSRPLGIVLCYRRIVPLLFTLVAVALVHISSKDIFFNV